MPARRGIATWYEVPGRSLAARRAPGEFTAAHNRLPLGSYARVTNLKEKRSVIVRITDRGVARKTAIDLCKEAGEEIGLIAKGRVEVEIQPLPAEEARTHATR